jgi:hypothetical protein
MMGENVPLLLAIALVLQAVPQPFPGGAPPARPAVQPGQRPATQPAPAAPRPAPATLTRAGGEQPPSDVMLGVAVYPTAVFIGSFDAGQGQRYYLFGSTASFADLVTYYRGVLRQRGELVFDEPATHMFEIGRFREESMAFPPSVTVKDYLWGGKGGYLNLRGGQPARFPTVIQIVPPPSGAAP